MKPRPEQQRRQAHSRRLALGRALHSILCVKWHWMKAWNAYQRGRGPKPERFRLPKYLRKKHRTTAYRLWMRA